MLKGGIPLEHKKLDTKFKIVISVVLLLLLGIISVLAIRASQASEENDSIDMELYYMNTGNTRMTGEKRRISGGTKEEILSSVLGELKGGPKIDGFAPSIPTDVKFLKVKLERNTVTLDVSDAYHEMRGGQEVICRSSIVWTLTELDFVKYVRITVEGKELTKVNGEPIGLMNRKNVVIDPVISPESKRKEIVKLYFSNDDASELVVEERKIEISRNQPREKCVMEELIKGPITNGLYATVPPETKLLDITTTDDGVCYVNLSSEFVSKHSGGSAGELLTVYSIVNSLTDLYNIDKVQFLIDGEKIDEFKGHIDFSKPFESVESLAK